MLMTLLILGPTEQVIKEIILKFIAIAGKMSFKINEEKKNMILKRNCRLDQEQEIQIEDYKFKQSILFKISRSGAYSQNDYH